MLYRAAVTGLGASARDLDALQLGATAVLAGRYRRRTEADAVAIGSVSVSPPRAEIAGLASLEKARGLAAGRTRVAWLSFLVTRCSWTG